MHERHVYNKLYYQPELNHTYNSLKNNIDFYLSRITASYGTHPFNQALYGVLYGVYSQHDSSFVCEYKDKIYEYINSKAHGIWKNMSNLPGTKNDIIINAVLLFMIMQGSAQMNIKGGVAESKFYYEDMKITSTVVQS